MKYFALILVSAVAIAIIILLRLFDLGCSMVVVRVDVVDVHLNEVGSIRLEGENELLKIQGLVEGGKVGGREGERSFSDLVKLIKDKHEQGLYAQMQKREDQYQKCLKDGGHLIFSLNKGYGYFAIARVEGNLELAIDESWKISTF